MARQTQDGADYLAQFEQSPYGFNANKRVQVEGKSTLRWSWRPAEVEDKKEK